MAPPLLLTLQKFCDPVEILGIPVVLPWRGKFLSCLDSSSPAGRSFGQYCQLAWAWPVCQTHQKLPNCPWQNICLPPKTCQKLLSRINGWWTRPKNWHLTDFSLGALNKISPYKIVRAPTPYMFERGEGYSIVNLRPIFWLIKGLN